NRTKLFARNHKWIVIGTGLLVALVIFITLFLTIGPFAGKKDEASLPDSSHNSTEPHIVPRLNIIILAMKTESHEDFEKSVDNVKLIISLSQIMGFGVEAFVIKDTCQQVKIENGTISGADLDAKNATLKYNFGKCQNQLKPKGILLVIPPCNLLAAQKEACKQLIANIENRFPFFIDSLAKADEILAKLQQIQAEG
uniref:Uncharacterized protein n=1 Tax=Panagrolaimus sp. JU765 TaxID=591449 RepID=A0AC34RAM6_9BILA